MVLVTGILTKNLPMVVFAESTNLKQEPRQNANCDTVGAHSPISNSCNQQSTTLLIMEYQRLQIPRVLN